MQYIRIEQLTKRSLELELERSTYAKDLELPRLLPLAKVKDSTERVIGLKLFNLDTHKVVVDTFGQLVDVIMIDGMKIAGIDLKTVFRCDDLLIPTIGNINLTFDDRYYNVDYMSSVDIKGEPLTTGFSTLIGVDMTKEEMMFIVMDASERISRLTLQQVWTTPLLGVDIARSWLAIASLQPYKELEG